MEWRYTIRLPNGMRETDNIEAPTIELARQRLESRGGEILEVKKAPKEKPPRMICEGCGRSYSIHTKRHVCRPPKGFEEKESPKETLAPPPVNPPTPPPNPLTPPAIPGPAERQLTLSDVTEFLCAKSKALRQQRRDDLLAKMF